MYRRIQLAILLALGMQWAYAQLQTPNEFLPFDHGKMFTAHYLLADYAAHVAANSEYVELQQYGETNERRPLLMAIISSPENLKNIEAIRQNNLKRTGLLKGDVDSALDKAIVWLSFGVHGNEAGASESSIATLYALANPDDKTKKYLENTIVIVDPSLNPDGYNRYSSWYNGIVGIRPDANTQAREHLEPWPAGRTNHYLHDLNRDWAWQTQVESQARMKVYRQWMPHIHADFHEQFPNNPYYFAPAAKPYHDYITDFQSEFQVDIGHNHAGHFDANGWHYFTGEIFDLFYPSYGDTYPIFNGAVGMTYEQGGHGLAGLSYLLENSDTLHLRDRINHHLTTALSTIEVASNNADRMIQNFTKYFDDSQNKPQGEYKTFIVRATNASDRIKRFCALLDKNGIEYGRVKSARNTSAYSYIEGKEMSIKIEKEDLVISAYQPLGVLTQVLLEPYTHLEDSLTYDITAWSLPYAYGLEAYATAQKIEVDKGYTLPAITNQSNLPSTPYAFVVEWESVNDARFLATLAKENIKVRFAKNPFVMNKQAYDRGSLIINRIDNKTVDNFEEVVVTIANKCGVKVNPTYTGLTPKGNDFGAESMALTNLPTIAVFYDDKASLYSFGQLWYFFEQDLDYPVSFFPVSNLSGLDLEEYNTLVLPEGYYGFDSSQLSVLKKWMNKGGNLIAIGAAAHNFADVEGFSLKRAKSKNENKAAKSRYGHQERDNISNMNPGAIVTIDLDETHPLSYGIGEEYRSIKTNSAAFALMNGGMNVGVITEQPEVIGFMGSNVKKKIENTVVYGVEFHGNGKLIYLVDNPLYRSFWDVGKLLFSNAVFFE